PQLDRPGVYTWRVRTFDGESFGPWIGSFFSYLPESALEWQQSEETSFTENLSFTKDNNIELAKNRFIFKAESAGFIDGDRALLSVNDDVVGAFFRGHNVAIFDGSTGQFLSFHVFDTNYKQDDAEAMAALIGGLAPGQLVMATIRDEGSASMTENAYQALESIGSSLTRQVKFRDSWAIIGRKGAPKGSVPEAMSKAGEGAVVIADTLFRFEKLGTVMSPEIGPVLAWKSLLLSFRDSPPQERVRFQIVGLNSETGKRDSVMTNIANVQEVDLSGIDARKYPTIELTAVLTTETGLNTPQFNSWSLDFVPPPDLVVGRGAIAVSADTVLAGTDVEVGVDVGNFGLSPADSLAISFLRSDAAAGNVEFGRAQAAEIAVDEIRHFSATLPTVDLQGRVRITLEADREKEVPEIHENNNRFSRFIWVVRDTVIPEIRVTFDGRAIANGDLVATNPNIVVEVRDAGNKTVQDTAQVFLILDDERVSYGPNPNQAQLFPQDLPDDPDLQALVVFSPQLADGDHTLEIIAKDPFDNVRFVQNQFFVNSEFVIANVMNVPNPFRNETDFTYVLTQPADEVRLKIYTIAGRLIRELDFAPTRAGFNKFHWNGRDHDGDSLSNGVYLYKIIARRGDQQMEVVDKFVVVR
ncbi:MAG: interleukin-like EMT inducer domain-containing protein, partial [bacterium]